MSALAKFALLFVIFIDIMGQGLVFPIIDQLVMSPSSKLLPEDTSTATRSFNYGIVIGSFFLAWFFGAPYISKLSDMIGRKPAIMICLFGALVGYGLTILALLVNSFWLLILGRAITGFTAGNQPIAQAALIDASATEEDRARNMSLTMYGVSAGLLGGPIIGGLLSDPAIVGQQPGFLLPFIAALVLVLGCMLMVAVGFRDTRQEREPFVLRPFEVVDVFLELRHHPVVVRLVLALVFFHLANIVFYIFVGNFVTAKFGATELETSGVFLVIGVAIALSSTFLVLPVQRALTLRHILLGTMLIWAVLAVVFALLPALWMTYLPIFAYYLIFGFAYPTFLQIFAGSVGPEHQGWVMGMTIAVFTFVGGTMSLVGGWMIGVNQVLPFAFVALCALIGAMIFWLDWRRPPVSDLLSEIEQRA